MTTPTTRPFAALALAACCAFTLTAHADLTEEQRKVPLEKDSTDPKLAKVVLLAGSVSGAPGGHEYFAGCSLLMDCLKQTPGVAPVMAADGWPKNEAIFDGAKTVVVYVDSGPKLSFLEAARWEKMRGLMEKGVGLVMLHQSLDIPEDHADEMKAWLGGVFQKDIGCRGHWDMDFANFPKHPVTRGVAPFSAPHDGFLFNMHFAPGAVPLVSGTVPDKARTSADAKANPGRAEVIGFAYERPNGGRSFAFTGAHLHANWSVEAQRRLVTNGILWTAKVEVPEAGAPVAVTDEQLKANFDDKSKPAPKEAK